jgi:hypothetical protein
MRGTWIYRIAFFRALANSDKISHQIIRSMKSVHSLVLLSVLSALSLTSCGQNWSWNGSGYKRAALGGTYYTTNFNGAPSFGGHGGGYGNGYSIWPQPTQNYGDYFTYDDEPTNVGNSLEH